MSRTTWKIVGLEQRVSELSKAFAYFGSPLTLTVDTVDPFIVAAIERAASDYGFALELVGRRAGAREGV